MPAFPSVRLTLAGLAPAVLLLAGCGSSSAPAAAGPGTVPAAGICTQIADVLGDGPDPGSDPVGYAEAQIGPLAAVHPTNPKLQSAVTTLDGAFRREFARGATPATKAEVKAGQRRVDGFCHGAAS